MTTSTRRSVHRRLILAPAAAVALGGGGRWPPGRTGQPAPATPSTRPARIVVRNIASPPVVELFSQKLFPAYQTEHPQHTVEPEWITGSGPALVDTLSVSKAAGTEPDLFFIGGNWIP